MSKLLPTLCFRKVGRLALLADGFESEQDFVPHGLGRLGKGDFDRLCKLPFDRALRSARAKRIATHIHGVDHLLCLCRPALVSNKLEIFIQQVEFLNVLPIRFRQVHFCVSISFV